MSKEGRSQALEWALNLIQQYEFVVLDTETTGLGPEAQIVQIAVIDHRGNPMIIQNIKPSVSIPASATAIHGITDVTVANAPLFEAVYPLLNTLLENRVVVAYNAAFDSRMVEQTCMIYDLPPINVASWECAMEQFACFYGQWNDRYRGFRRQKLTTACTHLGIPAGNAHDALGDAQMTLALVRRMAELCQEEVPPSAAESPRAPLPGQQFCVGQLVRHVRYGEGVVIGSNLHPNGEEVQVLFPGAIGQKTIFAEYLKPVE